MCIKISKKLNNYLSELDRYLVNIPVSEKIDILNELKNSFYERMKNGQTEEEILDTIESPKVLAMQYISETFTSNPSFSFTKFIQLLGLYSLASLAWISIIPSLAIIAFSFFISGGICLLAGFMGLFKTIFFIPIIGNIKFVFFNQEIIGFPALLIGILMAIIFTALGYVCWKGTIIMIRFFQTRVWKIKKC